MPIDRYVADAPVPVVLLRTHRHIVEHANPLACRAWRRPLEEMLGQSIFDAVPELHGTPFDGLVHGVFSSGQGHLGSEMPLMLGKDMLYLNFVYSPYRADDGVVDGVLVFAFDVTEQVLARKQVDRFRTEIENATARESQAEKEEFLAELEHQIRDPLAPMHGSLQLIRERMPDSPVAQQLAVLERQAQRLARLADEIVKDTRRTREVVARQPQPIAATGQQRRVLIVDDHKDGAEIMAELVREMGHEARAAFDGPSALSIAAEWTPNIVLLDLAMPGMNGYEVARELHTHVAKAARIIAVSGRHRDSDMARARKAGIHAHLVKPARIDVLESLLNEDVVP